MISRYVALIEELIIINKIELTIIFKSTYIDSWLRLWSFFFNFYFRRLYLLILMLCKLDEMLR